MSKDSSAEHDDGYGHVRSPRSPSGVSAALGTASRAAPSRANVAALLKSAVTARGGSGASRRGKATAGKADMLHEIQKSYGNAYAQKVVESYRTQRDPGRGPSSSGSGATAGSVEAESEHGPPPVAKLAALLAPTPAEPKKPAVPARAAKAVSAGRSGAHAVAGAATTQPVASAGRAKGDGATPARADSSGAAADADTKGGGAKGRAAKGGAPGGSATAEGGAAAAKGGAAKGGDAGAKEKKPTLRLDAGGGPIAGAGGGRGGGGGGGGRGAAKSPASPDEDPAFQEVKKRTKAAGAREASHPSARSRADGAQGAAVGPPNEVSSKASANQAGSIDQQQPKPFNRAAFKAALMAKIQELSPKNLEEADEFKEKGKAGDVKGAVSSEVKTSKEGSERDIKGKTKETPSTSGIEPKPVTPLAPNQAGAGTGSVGATEAAPKPKTDAEVSLKEGSKKLDDEWKETGLDDQAVGASNEPSFKKALVNKKGAQKDAAERPDAYRKVEEGEIAKAEQQAEVGANAELADMHATKKGALGAITKGQRGTKSKDEQERERVASEMQAIFDRTKAAVEKRLASLDTEVNQAFDQGAERARNDFESYVDQRMRAYKDDRYGGRFGGIKWAKDKLFGMPDEVNVFYEEGRDLYLRNMDAVIDNVATLVETGLKEAKELIAKGKQEIDDYVAHLDPSLKKIGKEAAEGFESQFQELESSVDDKSKGLVDSLAKKYVDNLGKLDERIKEMKEANKGLVDGAIAKIKELIKTLRELKNMLFNTLARVAAVIGKIIRHPIRFLGNLVAGVKQGIAGFKERIGKYLMEGLMAWLFGALGDAGITMPESFDFKGILHLVLQILGLTYANIRARAVKIVGEPVVKALETAAEIFKILLTEGPAGLWNYIKDQIGNLKEMILEGLKSFIIEKIVIAGITWLIGLLNPASAFIKACKAIYDIVMFFVQRASQIMSFVNAVIDSMSAIADGAISVAAAAVESALAKAIPVVLGFLAALLGLGGIGEKIRSIIEKVRAPINKAIDWVINKAVSMVKAVGKFFGIGKKDKPAEKGDPEHDAKVAAGLHAIDVAEEPLTKDGTLDLEDAEKVALNVRRAHPIFKSITVKDAGDHWDYDYTAKKGTKASRKKGAQTAEDVQGKLIGTYPQNEQRAKAPTKHKSGKKAQWESHHVPQKVLGRYFEEVYDDAATATTTSAKDKTTFKSKAAIAKKHADEGKGLSAVLLSNVAHDIAHESLDTSEIKTLRAKFRGKAADAPIFAVRKPKTQADLKQQDKRVTAAATRSSVLRGVEEAGEDPATKKEIKNVFGRVFKGGLTIAKAGVAKAISPKKLASIDNKAKTTWASVVDPDK